MKTIIRLVILAGILIVAMWIVLGLFGPHAPSPFGPPLDKSPVGR